MSTLFPFVQIPENLLPMIGKRDKSTHIYRMEGPEDAMGDWYTLLTETVGPTLSPGGVRMYCPVSRAAVHKRTKEGKLSIFLYHPTADSTGLFGKVKRVRSAPYGYIPLSEIQAWRQEIEERAIQKNEITREELEGAKPDWDGDHMKWPVKSERPGLKEALQELGIDNPKHLVTEIAKAMLRLKKTDDDSPISNSEDKSKSSRSKTRQTKTKKEPK